MRKLFIASATVISLFFAACGSSEKPAAAADDSASVKTAAVSYTCPMHPEIISNKPGKCPKCNMDLVKSEGSEMQPDSTHQGHSH